MRLSVVSLAFSQAQICIYPNHDNNRNSSKEYANKSLFPGKIYATLLANQEDRLRSWYWLIRPISWAAGRQLDNGTILGTVADASGSRLPRRR